MHGEASETTSSSSRAYHDISSSSVHSCSRSARVNSIAVAELALGDAVVIDLLIMGWWICTRCAAGALRSCGLESRKLGHSSSSSSSSSSSDVSGVVGISLLEQADMLESEGVGERVRGRGGDFDR